VCSSDLMGDGTEEEGPVQDGSTLTRKDEFAMKKRVEQTELVLNWLKRYKYITSQLAWRRWSVTRLADVIMKLRKRGYRIETELIPNGRTHFAKYWYIPAGHSEP